MTNHFNRAISALSLFTTVLVVPLAGCEEDAPPIKAVERDQGKPAIRYDLGPSSPLPVAVTDIFTFIPEAPEGIRARPGDAASKITQINTIKVLKPFNRVYAETFTNGPFRRVTYTLSSDRTQVERVVANFNRDYGRDDRVETLVELIETRLGKTTKAVNKKESTYSWRLPEYGLQLRKDLNSSQYFSSAPLDFIYDRRLANTKN